MGVRPTFDDHDARPGVLQTDAFRFTFDRLPGSPNIDPGVFSLDCLASTWPGRTIGKIDQNYAGGHTISYPGKATQTRTIASRFIERPGFTTHTTVNTWMEMVKGSRSGNAAFYYKAGLTAVGLLEMFDETGAVANSCRIINMWPSELAEISPDADSADQALIWQVTWSFGRSEDARTVAR